MSFRVYCLAHLFFFFFMNWFTKILTANVKRKRVVGTWAIRFI